MSVAIIGSGSESDNHSIRLATKKKQWIPNTQKLERSFAALRAAKTLWTQRIPAIRPRSLSATYNCVGLVFGCRRTCIAPEDIKMILDDDGFSSISIGEAVLGDVAVYYLNNEPQHIGIVIEITNDLKLARESVVWILSQWGDDGEYIHRLNDVPQAFGKDVRFFSERMTT